MLVVPSGLTACTEYAGDAKADAAPLSDVITDEGGDHTIAAGSSFIIDRSYTVRNLTIRGKLSCATNLKEPITITATSIEVVGAGALFECGNEQSRFTGNIRVLLRPTSSMSHDHTGSTHTMSGGTLSVSEGGTLRLFGGRVETFGWQRIAHTVVAGATTVDLERSADWQPGDVIAIGPTGFNFAEAEERVVERVDGTRVTVTTPFAHEHLAFSKMYTEGERHAELSERAEIANLTRNIVIGAAGDEVTLRGTKRGVGVMVRAGGRAFVDGVEIARGGQLGVLGSYPFHWHLVGEAPGQFLRNSSIHHSFQRCVTIHGTNHATVENNVCFDHLGHGYFFEQGNEVKNTVRGNLGMLSRRVESGMGLLDSDMRSDQPLRFSAPSTFWVTNPDNEIVGNVASGSEGTGFWMAFSQGIHCGTPPESYACDGPGASNNVVPARVDTLKFDDNVAHSAMVGITWDGAEDGAPSEIATKNPGARKTVSTHYWHDKTAPTFDSLQAWKNVATGIYFRGAAATFTHLVTADNGRSLFFAYNQRVDAGLTVGISEAMSQRDVDYGRSLPPDVRLYGFAGALIYDGPFDLKDVHFADFTTRFAGLPALPFFNIGGANRSVNQVRHVTFANISTPRVTLFGDSGWGDTLWTTAVRDDGSISGKAGLLLPDHPMNSSAGECEALSASAVDRGLRCQYQWGVLELSGSKFDPGYDAIHVPIKFERIDNATGAIVSSDALERERLTNKTGLIVGDRYRYRLSISQTDARPQLVAWTWQPETPAMSPVIEIDGVAAARCRPARALAEAPSRAALLAATETAYLYESGNLYMRLSPGGDQLACP